METILVVAVLLLIGAFLFILWSGLIVTTLLAAYVLVNTIRSLYKSDEKVTLKLAAEAADNSFAKLAERLEILKAQ